MTPLMMLPEKSTVWKVNVSDHQNQKRNEFTGICFQVNSLKKLLPEFSQPLKDIDYPVKKQGLIEHAKKHNASN